MSGEDAPRPCLENLIVPEIKTNKQDSGGIFENALIAPREPIRRQREYRPVINITQVKSSKIRLSLTESSQRKIQRSWIDES